MAELNITVNPSEGEKELKAFVSYAKKKATEIQNAFEKIKIKTFVDANTVAKVINQVSKTASASEKVTQQLNKTANATTKVKKQFENVNKITLTKTKKEFQDTTKVIHLTEQAATTLAAKLNILRSFHAKLRQELNKKALMIPSVKQSMQWDPVMMKHIQDYMQYSQRLVKNNNDLLKSYDNMRRSLKALPEPMNMIIKSTNNMHRVQKEGISISEKLRTEIAKEIATYKKAWNSYSQLNKSLGYSTENHAKLWRNFLGYTVGPNVTKEINNTKQAWSNFYETFTGVQTKSLTRQSILWNKLFSDMASGTKVFDKFKTTTDQLSKQTSIVTRISKAWGTFIDKLKSFATTSSNLKSDLDLPWSKYTKDIEQYKDHVKIATDYMDRHGVSYEVMAKQAAKAWKLNKEEAQALKTELKNHRTVLENTSGAYGRLHEQMKKVNQKSQLMNSLFAKFSVYMSGIAATIFVFQNIARLLGSLVGVGMGFEKTMAGINQKFKITKEQYDLLKTAARTFGETTSMSAKDALASLKKLMDGGKTAGEAVMTLWASFEKNEEASKGIKTIDDALDKFMNTLYEINYKIFDKYKDEMQNSLDDLSRWIQQNEDDIVSFFSNIIETAKGLKGVTTLVLELVGALGKLIGKYNELADLASGGNGGDITSSLLVGLITRIITKDPKIALIATTLSYAKTVYDKEFNEQLDKLLKQSDKAKEKTEDLNQNLQAAAATFNSISWEDPFGDITNLSEWQRSILGINKTLQTTATIVNSIDGDTLAVLLEGGDNRPNMLRFWGINTPESVKDIEENMPTGLLASAFLDYFIKEGDTIKAELSGETDAYGRLIATVFTDGMDIAVPLLETGLASRMKGAFANVKYDEAYSELESGFLEKFPEFQKRLNTILSDLNIDLNLSQKDDFVNFEKAKPILKALAKELGIIYSRYTFLKQAEKEYSNEAIYNAETLSEEADNYTIQLKKQEQVTNALVNLYAKYKDDPFFKREQQLKAFTIKAKDIYKDLLTSEDKLMQESGKAYVKKYVNEQMALYDKDIEWLKRKDEVEIEYQKRLDKELSKIRNTAIRDQLRTEAEITRQAHIIGLKEQKAYMNDAEKLQNKANKIAIESIRDKVRKQIAIEQKHIKQLEEIVNVQVTSQKKVQDKLTAITLPAVKQRINEELALLEQKYAQELLMAEDSKEDYIALLKQKGKDALKIISEGAKEQAELYSQSQRVLKLIAKSEEDSLTREQIRMKLRKANIALVDKLIKNELLLESQRNAALKALEQDLTKSDEKYRNDKLQAMKSLYGDLEEISGNYYNAQVQIIEMEYEKYKEALGLKKKDYQSYTEEEKQLLDALNRWKILQTAKLYQQLLIYSGGFFSGVKAYLLQTQIDWQHFGKQFGEFGYDTFKKVGQAFEDSVYNVLKNDFESIGDLWEALLDDLLNSFIRLIANMIKEWAISGLGELVIGFSDSFFGKGNTISNITNLLLGEDSSTGGFSLLNALGLGKTGYELYTGDSLITQAYNYISDALFGTGATFGAISGVALTSEGIAAGALGSELGFGLPAGYLMATEEALDAATATLGTMSTLSESLSAFSAAAPYAAVAIAALQGAMAWASSANNEPSSLSTIWNVQSSVDKDKLFDAILEGVNVDNGSWDQADIVKTINTSILDQLNEALGSYNAIFRNLGEESQKQLKETFKNFEGLNLLITQIASAGAPMYAMAGLGEYTDYGTLYYNAEYGGAGWTGTPTTMPSWGSGRKPTALYAIDDYLSKYFEQYIEEAVRGLKDNDMFEFMSDEIQASIESVDLTMFKTDIGEFNKMFTENADLIQKASIVWEDFNNWIEGTTKKYTEYDKVSGQAQAELTGFIAQMEAFGKTLTEDETKVKLEEIFNTLAEDVDLDALAKPMTAIDSLIATINGKFDAYLEMLQEYGVDLEKITDLEDKRAEVITREVAALKEQTWASINATVDDMLGKTSSLEGNLNNVNTAFADVYTALEGVFGIADQSELIQEYKKELENLTNAFDEEKQKFISIIDELKSGDVSSAVDYFTGELKKLEETIGSPGQFETIIASLSGTFQNFAGDLTTFSNTSLFKDEYGFWDTQFNAIGKAHDTLAKAITDFSATLSGMSTEDIISGIENLTGLSETYRTELQKIVNEGSTWWNGVSEAEVDYAQAVLDWLDFFDVTVKSFSDELTKLSETSGSTEDIEKIKEILNLLNGDDLSEDTLKPALDYLEEQLKALEDSGGGSAEQIQWLKDTIDELTNATEAYIAMEEKQLLALKMQMGLVSETVGQQMRLDEIADKYKQFGLSFQEMIDWFTDASISDIKAVADALGIDWTEIANDIGFLVDTIMDLGGATQKILDAQWELLGTTTEEKLKALAIKYNTSEFDEAKAQDIIDWFAHAPTQEIIDVANAYGVSVDEFIEDIMFLQDAFDLAGESFEALAENIRTTLDDIEVDLQGLLGSIGGNEVTAEGLWSQLEDMKNTFSVVYDPDTGEPSTTAPIETLSTMTELLAQWYDLSVQAARDAGQEELDVLRAQDQLVDKIADLVEQVDNTIENIKYSDLNVNLPAEKAPEALSDYMALYNAALTGGTAEIQEYLSFASTFLRQQQDAYKSSEEYQQAYEMVMGPGGHMEIIKDKLESGGYDTKILEELLQENNELTIEQTDAYKQQMAVVRALFGEMKTWITVSLEAVENFMELKVTFEGLNPDSADHIMEFLMYVSETYGWDSEVTLYFVAELDWSAFDANQISTMLQSMVDSVGWNATATLTLLANVNWDSSSFTAQYIKDTLDDIVAAVGWESDAAVTFLGNVTWDPERFGKQYIIDKLHEIVSAVGWNSEAAVTFLANVNWNSSEFTAIDIQTTLDEIVSAVGWESDAAVTFLATVDWDNEKFTAEYIQTTLDNIVSAVGWESDTAVTFLANVTWDPNKFGEQYINDTLQDIINSVGWTSDAAVTFVGQVVWGEMTKESIVSHLNTINTLEEWQSDAALKFIGSIDWGLFTADEIISYLQQIADLDAWTIQTRLTFAGSIDWGSLSTTQLQSAIDSLFDDIDLNSTVSLDLIATMSDAGIPWDELKNALIEKGYHPSEVQKTLVAAFKNLDSTTNFSSWSQFLTAWNLVKPEGDLGDWATKGLTAMFEADEDLDTITKWSQFALAFDAGDATPAEAEKTLSAVYSATTGQGLPVLFSDFISAWEETNPGKQLDATTEKELKAIFDKGTLGDISYDDFISAWEETNPDQELDATVKKTIESAYETGVGADGMTWTELEDLLEATGTPTTVIRDIKAHVDSAVTVELTEMDIWKTQVGLLIGILQNTAIIAAATGGGSQSLGTVSGYFRFPDWDNMIKGNLYTTQSSAFGTGTNLLAGISGGGASGWTPYSTDLLFSNNKESIQVSGHRLYTNTYISSINGVGTWENSLIVSILDHGNVANWIKQIRDNTAKMFTSYQKVKVYGSNGGLIKAQSDGMIVATYASPNFWDGLLSKELTTNMSNRDYAMLQAIAVATHQTTDYLYYGAETTESTWKSMWNTYANLKYMLTKYQFAEGGIASGPDTGYAATLHGTELVISPTTSYPATVINGGSTSAGANKEELDLLRELVKLQKEQIDTLRASNRPPNISVNVDGQELVKKAGEYVSEKSKRGMLDVRIH